MYVLCAGALGFPMRGMNSSAAPPLSRSGLNQSAGQLSSTPNAGSMHTPPSPSRYLLLTVWIIMFGATHSLSSASKLLLHVCQL